jgi:hypothetical protein
LSALPYVGLILSFFARRPLRGKIGYGLIEIIFPIPSSNSKTHFL